MRSIERGQTKNSNFPTLGEIKTKHSIFRKAFRREGGLQGQNAMTATSFYTANDFRAARKKYYPEKPPLFKFSGANSTTDVTNKSFETNPGRKNNIFKGGAFTRSQEDISGHQNFKEFREPQRTVVKAPNTCQSFRPKASSVNTSVCYDYDEAANDIPGPNSYSFNNGTIAENLKNNRGPTMKFRHPIINDCISVPGPGAYNISKYSAKASKNPIISTGPKLFDHSLAKRGIPGPASYKPDAHYKILGTVKFGTPPRPSQSRSASINKENNAPGPGDYSQEKKNLPKRVVLFNRADRFAETGDFKARPAIPKSGPGPLSYRPDYSLVRTSSTGIKIDRQEKFPFRGDMNVPGAGHYSFDGSGLNKTGVKFGKARRFIRKGLGVDYFY